jgi:hypothetical protein
MGWDGGTKLGGEGGLRREKAMGGNGGDKWYHRR